MMGRCDVMRQEGEQGDERVSLFSRSRGPNEACVRASGARLVPYPYPLFSNERGDRGERAGR